MHYKRLKKTVNHSLHEQVSNPLLNSNCSHMLSVSIRYDTTEEFTCGRHGLILGPLSFVAVIAVAVMVCGRHGIDPNF